jgi:hypothetical protein
MRWLIRVLLQLKIRAPLHFAFVKGDKEMRLRRAAATFVGPALVLIADDNDHLPTVR